MKILCIPYSHTLSHVSRPLSVAKKLARRGHEVSFAGNSPKTEFIRHEGFSVVPLYEPDPSELFGNIRAGKIRFVSDAEIEQMINADLEIYWKHRHHSVENEHFHSKVEMIQYFPGGRIPWDEPPGDSLEEWNIWESAVLSRGDGTIYQALQHGRPVVCIPTIPDQMFNGRTVEALGVGKTLAWREFTRSPVTLLETIRHILKDVKFSENAERMSGVLSSYAAAETSADLIESTFL